LIPAPVPFSSATLWRRVKAGTFPKPVKLSERVTAWRVEDIRQWLDAQTHHHSVDLAPPNVCHDTGQIAVQVAKLTVKKIGTGGSQESP
jgi:hypothetical protein